MQIRHLTAAAALCSVGLFSTTSEGALVNYSLVSGHFADEFGVRVTDAAAGAGTLFQLVNLGPNGVFDGIDLADGNTSQLGQWVSGDDSLLNVVLLGTSDYPNTNAFDLVNGLGASAGVLNRTFQFDVPTGTKFGIRWFPGLQAGSFNSISLAAGQKFGQFTRQDDLIANGPLYDGVVYAGGNLWVGGSDGATIALDAMRTASAGGTDPTSVANATLVVVPEPAALGLAFMGAMGIFALRRRR